VLSRCQCRPLRYGAFDFMVTEECFVFLEVNVDGDWAWFEAAAGEDSRVSDAFRQLLVELYKEQTCG
jgi:hypothetical protein